MLRRLISTGAALYLLIVFCEYKHPTSYVCCRILVEMTSGVVDPLIDCDWMTSILASPYGDCVKSMFEAFFVLVDKV